MPWPTANITTTSLDDSTDKPPRATLLALVRAVNSMMGSRGAAGGVCDIVGGKIPIQRIDTTDPTLRGPPGDRGPTGDPGDKGPRGARGAKGRQGLSAAAANATLDVSLSDNWGTGRIRVDIRNGHLTLRGI